MKGRRDEKHGEERGRDTRRVAARAVERIEGTKKECEEGVSGDSWWGGKGLRGRR